MSSLEKEFDKERKDREKWEAKVSQMDDEINFTKKATEKVKSALEKEIKDLKARAADIKNSSSSTKQLQLLNKENEDLHEKLEKEQKRFDDLNSHWEKLSEETILMRAQLTTEKESLQAEINSVKQKLSDVNTLKTENENIVKRLRDSQKRVQELESKQIKSGSTEYEKTVLKNQIIEKDKEYDRLRRENEMNIDLVFQLRKDNDEISRKLSDFNRIQQAQSSLNGHSERLENEVKALQKK